jgi:dynein light chain roadblock-type
MQQTLNKLSSREAQASVENMRQTLQRLSSKAGVVATLALDRSTGALIQTTGSIASKILAPSTTAPRTFDNTAPAIASETASSPQRTAEADLESFAAMAWNFANAAGALVHGLDSEVCCDITRVSS